MALKERFWEAAQNRLGFILLLLCLGCCYYFSNTILSLFSCFVPSSSLIWWGKQKLWHAVQKTDSVCFIEKIFKNQQFIFLSWIFYTACPIQLLTCNMFWVLLFELQNCTWKINLYNLSCFGRLSKSVQIALISLWEVLCEEVFKCAKGHDERRFRSAKILSLGMRPEPPRNIQGDPSI